MIGLYRNYEKWVDQLCIEFFSPVKTERSWFNMDHHDFRSSWKRKRLLSCGKLIFHNFGLQLRPLFHRQKYPNHSERIALIGFDHF
jgi:hypothetical protein